MDPIADSVDGKLIVIRDKTALPQRCIRTNEPVSDSEYTTWDLPYIPRWLMVAMLLVPILLIFAPFAIRRRCHVRAGLSRRIRARYLLLKLAAGLAILLSLVWPSFLLLATTQVELAVLAMLLFPLFFWGGFAILILATSPLRIVGMRDDLFWIKGCSPVFLNSLHTSVPNKA